MTANPAALRPVDLVLASASPRRRELLERMGLRLLVLPADVDETPLPGENPADHVRRLAAAKGDAVWARLTPAEREQAAVLAADTIVVVDADILGKPRDEGDARAMLDRLAGRRHTVLTAYQIRRAPDRLVARAVSTAVSFRLLQPAEIDAYLASGEWAGKAGGYAVQGIAAAFVSELRGSHTNVIGLPVAEVIADLLAVEALPGYPPPAFGGPP
ncbi:MAG: nucleoside triphosphate pyrophosphatase [Myxococcales bacterium]|jgi:septum formation protein|nr:nucleoside triphosphate pyrophosphatase [Myxococcales bacterium]